MNFVNVFGFDVKEGRSAEFQQWLSGNEEKLALECPKGSEYAGTYANVMTSEKHGGSFMTVWRMESYGAMDAWSAAMKEHGTFAALMEEYTEFIDQRNDAHWSNIIGRRVTDAAMWGD